MSEQKPSAKYGWEICDEVQRFVSNASDMQWVPKADLEAAQKEIESLKAIRHDMSLAYVKLGNKFDKAVEALNRIYATDRCKGYPTGAEWMAMVDEARRTLREVEGES